MNTVLKASMTCLKRLAGRLAMILVVPAVSLWMVLAVWFSNLPGTVLPGVVAVAVVLALLIILAVVRGRWHAIGLIVCLFAVIYGWYLLIPASNDRNWQPPVARLSTAEYAEGGDQVTVRNIRHFDYRSRHDFDAHYEDRTFALDQICGVDLIVSYWGNEAMAHTFLSFEFETGDPLAVSIEIRPEMGETYHPLAGLFKQYEIIYVLGDERDLIRVRTNHRGEETYLYQSTASPGQARRLLVEILDRVNQLARKPAYYGTIRANCTTSLVKHVNKILVDDIPFSGRLLFNGFSDRLAFSAGTLQKKLPFQDLKTACYISEKARLLGDDSEFSAKIRSHIQATINVRQGNGSIH